MTGQPAGAPFGYSYIDEHTRQCLAIQVARLLTSRDVILSLSRLMRLYGKP